jgi:hypothetical protein
MAGERFPAKTLQWLVMSWLTRATPITDFHVRRSLLNGNWRNAGSLLIFPLHELLRYTNQEAKMKLALIGIAAVATAAFATPVLAQQVIEDPGYCAQFYPNANCQNMGPGNPYTDGNWRNGNASMEHPRVHLRHPTHRG